MKASILLIATLLLAPLTTQAQAPAPVSAPSSTATNAAVAGASATRKQP